MQCLRYRLLMFCLLSKFYEYHCGLQILQSINIVQSIQKNMKQNEKQSCGSQQDIQRKSQQQKLIVSQKSDKLSNLNNVKQRIEKIINEFKDTIKSANVYIGNLEQLLIMIQNIQIIKKHKSNQVYQDGILEINQLQNQINCNFRQIKQLLQKFILYISKNNSHSFKSDTYQISQTSPNDHQNNSIITEIDDNIQRNWFPPYEELQIIQINKPIFCPKLPFQQTFTFEQQYSINESINNSKKSCNRSLKMNKSSQISVAKSQFFYKKMDLNDSKELKILKKQLFNVRSVNLSTSNLDNIELAIFIKNCNPYLKVFICENSLLTDESGSICAQFKFLEVINVNGNNISDNFMLEIQELIPNLIEIKLGFTNISDHTIDLIHDKNKIIETIDVSYTKITSKGLIKILKLEKLKNLHVWSGWKKLLRYSQHLQKYKNKNKDKFTYNKINIDDQCIQLLKNKVNSIQSLSVNLQKINLINFIDKINPKICNIEVGTYKFTQKQVAKLLNNQNLKSVYLQNTNVCNLSFMSQNIEYMSLRKCKIDKQCLNKLNQQKILGLDLTDTNLSCDISQKLSKLKHLKQLYLENTKIQDKTLQAIRYMSQLKILNLSHNKLIGESIIYLAQLLSIQVLNLHNTKTADNSINVILSQLKSLKILDIGKTLVTDNCVQYLMKHEGLTSLCIINVKINDDLKKKLGDKIEELFY